MQLKENNGTLFWVHVAAVLTVTAWGLSVVSTKVLLQNGLYPTEIYIYRSLIAYLVILAACHREIFAHSLRDELLLMVCGVLGGSIYFVTENMALSHTLATNVSLIVTTSPLITTLLVGVLYRNERIERGVVVGSVIAFLGVACVIFNSSFVIKVKPVGDLLALTAAVSFAIYSIVLRNLNAGYGILFITRKTFFYGVITALPFMALEPQASVFSHPAVFLSLKVWSNLLFLGVFASMLAFVVWSNAVKRLGPVKASNYLYFVPIVTLAASALLINEKITLVGYLGCVLILGGVWFGDILVKHKKYHWRWPWR